MKIIEAMKRVKLNKEKITDLQTKIGGVSANLSIESPVYGTDTRKKIDEWLQSCEDISQENIRLLCGIQRTNLATRVVVDLDGKPVEKSIAEWVWRRREYAAIDKATWSRLTDRGLKEGQAQLSPGAVTDVKIVRHYDPERRDKKIAIYHSEPHLIDAALEITNATTDLMEVAA